MTIDEFRAKAEACTNMQQLDMLWVNSMWPTSRQNECAQIYQARKRELEEDGKTGERLEALPEGY